MKKKQIWFCEDCQTVGAVKHKEHAGVYEVVNLTDDSHKKLSPECETPVSGARTMNSSIANLPEWAQEKAQELSATGPGDSIS